MRTYHIDLSLDENDSYPIPSPTESLHRLERARDIGEADTWSDEDDSDSAAVSKDASGLVSRSSMDIQMESADAVGEVLRETTSNLMRSNLAYERVQSLWASIPPKNFGEVRPGVYRSSFPKTENLSFLAEKRIKTIVTFVPEQYSTEQKNFLKELGINHVRIPIEANKDPFNLQSHAPIIEALGQILDSRNYPLLIHCNKGKHRTGCVVACYRKFLGWDKARILHEYRQYAGLKARALDELYIDRFDERAMQIMALQAHLVDSNDEPMADSPISRLIPNSRLRG